MSPKPVFTPLDVHSVPLLGLNLIEASAGTGKTWTITCLYARLILEQKLKVDDILVVTYTKAATAELRGRIRARLVDLLEAFKASANDLLLESPPAQPDKFSGAPQHQRDSRGANIDPFCRTVVDQYRSQDTRGTAIRRLSHAVLGFDEAAIYTIHGFCQRILNDSAFESGIEFESELLTDETGLLREIVDDFWRRDVAPQTGLWPDYLACEDQSPDRWLDEIKPHVGKPFLKVLAIDEDRTSVPSTHGNPMVLPGEAHAECPESAVERAYAACHSLWREQQRQIGALLLDSDALNGTKYNKNSIPDWIASLDDYFASPKPGFSPPGKFSKFKASELQAGCKKGKSAPIHTFFDACETLGNALDALVSGFKRRLLATKVRLLHVCNEELPQRKQGLRRLSYHDLLNRLAQALESDHGEHLAQTIRARYRAALIDEFQDTDPVQYTIFSRVYEGQKLPLFFVGDPKQAIYSFRGADIYSYLKAHHAAQRHYTLSINQRSTPELVTAVNALFKRNASPFLLEAIVYHEVGAAKKDRPDLLIEGDAPQPFRFVMLSNPDDGKPLNKTDAGALAVESVASEVVRLLNLGERGKANLQGADGNRPVNGGDIAVLTFTHHQARKVQEALSVRNVPSVRQGQDNVFASPEARELERVLNAIVEPGRESLVKAALVTELMGFYGDDIATMQIDEEAWERQLENFQHYRELWLGKGFIVMFRRWFANHDVAIRLLGHRNGERRLTNLLHLAERLQVESRDKVGCETLLGWFARTIHDPGDDEEALLRLESDADRVKIVTIHTSKGLEYPIVFCPFLWDGTLWKKGESGVSFHQADHDYQACLDFGSEAFEQHKALASIEKLAEKLRLVYVALTRAQHRCYIVWGEVKSKGDAMERAALSWLLHGPAGGAEEPLESLKERIKSLNCEDIRSDITVLAKQAPAAIRVDDARINDNVYLPSRVEAQVLAPSDFRRDALRPNWRMTSFTGITAGRHSETPDYDSVDQAQREELPGNTIFTFPRGPLPGICLHSVFEEWPFDCTDLAALKALVQSKLKTYAIADSWTDIVADTVHATLQARLSPDGLKLAGLGARQKLMEMEFTYPLHDVSVASLQALLAAPVHRIDVLFTVACRQLRFERIEGFMKGFIDLVFQADGRFYLVDYKSNWLGNRAEDYVPERLKQAIAQHHYYLQYLIYSLALHRYLASRMPHYSYERHFGGVYYLFLRGIDAAVPGNGIFFERPENSLIRALDDLIANKEAAP